MSGHSKWSTIKRKKGAADAKRGQTFTKLGRAIAIASREGGPNPDSNFSLRLIIDKARQANMPVDNIDRAIKRGAGMLEGQALLEKAVYGGYGPGGVAVAVDVLTDNKNRTVSEIRKIFEEHGGAAADAGSVLWQFSEKGLVVVKCAKKQASVKFGEGEHEVPVPYDELAIDVMDIPGIEDVGEEDRTEEDGCSRCEIVTAVKDLASVRKDIDAHGYIVESAELIKMPQQQQQVSASDMEKVQGLVDALEEHDDVESVWTTMKRS